MQSVKCFLEAFSRRGWAARCATLALLLVLSPAVLAQSLFSGDITGTVTDPSGAVVPNATINLKSLDTGAAQTTTTNAAGFYRFALLKPGRYQVTMNESGFQPVQSNVVVAVGQATTTNIALKVGGATQTVEVTAEAPVINTETPSINTSFSQLEVRNLPNGGQDLTNIAQTTPGTVMSTGMGYGNFTTNGLPATSNLFTVNGENDMDPYFNINNSGATNLTLGANEIQEATVISNPYAGQYGQFAGSQVTYLTRSGTNAFHGNAEYFWNGRALNANDWFANNSGTPRPFANNNQFAASLGGPIIKDKTFFFVDFEGLRYVLPTVQQTYIPTPQFATAVLGNLATAEPAEVGMYQKMFNLYASAPGAQLATPLPYTASQNFGGCDNVVDATGTTSSLPGFTPGTSCLASFTATPGQLSHEWILATRIDQNLGSNDKLFARYRMDRGLQATLTDPINKAFNAFSPQPAYDGQLQETHVFGPRATNSFLGALSHYSAVFTQNQPLANNTFPYAVTFGAPMQLTSFNLEYDFPQGRNVTQYQFVDDFSYDVGNHDLKFGVNFRRYDITDLNFFYQYPRAEFGYGATDMLEFANGISYSYVDRLNTHTDVPIATYGLGFYGQDEWHLKPNFTLTLGMRFERNSDPVCQVNCFSNFVGPFNTLSHGTTVPYNQNIATGLHQAYPGVDVLSPSPRVGFNWSPGSSQKTVISGGYGIFYDSPPAGLVDDLLANVPNTLSFRVLGAAPFDPASGAATVAASIAGFQSGFTAGQSYSQIKAAVPIFSAPTFTAIEGTIHNPMVQEWNLQIQREIGSNSSVMLNYVGNKGDRYPYTNGTLNMWDRYGSGGGVAAAPADPSYNTVEQVQSGAISNYNGLTATVRHRFSSNISGGLNYTWSHALDDVSNGGIFVYNGADSLEGQLNPFCFKCNNYGNADYDVRHYISAYYLYQPGFKFGNSFLNQVLGGWQWSGKIFWRTGLPFTVEDGNGAFAYYQFTNPPAQPILPGATPGQSSCGEAAASANGNGTPCLDAAAFFPSATTAYPNFPTQRRNQYRGPGFFDMDMSLVKNFKLTEKLTFGIGANAFNVFNHPNFNNPDNYLGDSTFGQIQSTTAVPASPYGSFVGAAAAPRILQITGKVTF